MYICICQGITEKQLQEAVTSRKGQSAKDIMKSLGLGSDCGSCVEDALKQMIQASNQAPREAKDTPKIHQK